MPRPRSSSNVPTASSRARARSSKPWAAPTSTRARPNARAQAFAALLEVDPSSHYAHYALGQSLKRLGRRKEAGTHLRLAVALNSRSTLYRDALARLWFRAVSAAIRAEFVAPGSTTTPRP